MVRFLLIVLVVLFFTPEATAGGKKRDLKKQQRWERRAEKRGEVILTACTLNAGAEDNFKACVCSTGPNNTCTTADKLAAKALAEAQLGTHWCFDNSCTGPCKADTDCTVEDHIRSHDDADACEDTDWLCCYRFSNCTRESDCNCTQVGGG